MFKGYCPECLLKGEEVLMQLNREGYLECPACQLQITLQQEVAAILRWRGQGSIQPAITPFEVSVLLTETSKEEGQETEPAYDHSLKEMWELEWYLHEVYDDYKAFKRHQFDTKDPLFAHQRAMLDAIGPAQWQQLFESYLACRNSGISINVVQHPLFKICHRLLLRYGVIFEFKWHAWHRGWVNVRNPKFNFYGASLLELSMYLSAIFLSEPYDEGSIEFYFNNKTLDRIIMAMEHRTGVKVLTLD